MPVIAADSTNYNMFGNPVGSQIRGYQTIVPFPDLSHAPRAVRVTMQMQGELGSQCLASLFASTTIKPAMNEYFPSTGTSRRLLALDGLRGLAALLVVFFHIGWPNHLTTNNFVVNGYLSVDLFFIMSGFIIVRNYGAKIANTGNLANFICLRFFRVYPLHFFVLAVLVCLELAKLFMQGALPTPSEQAPFSGNTSISALIANLFLVQGLHVLKETSWNVPSWTISSEFAAYLVFGVLAGSGLMRRKLFFPCALVVGGLAYVGLALERGGLDITYDWGVVRCLAGFFLGATVMLPREFEKDRRLQLPMHIAAVASVIAIVLVMSLAHGWEVVLVIPAFVAAVGLLQTDQGPAARVLMHPFVQFLGRISYSIYMVQYVTILVLTISVKRLFKVALTTDPVTHKFIILINPWIGDALVLVSVLAIVLIAQLTYSWIESPARAFGRRLTGWSVRGPGRFRQCSGDGAAEREAATPVQR
ncbi:MAG TPA: acyltransferase [Xanthobacteraceae bacterium]|jgi:peptidoglycan/LPS O-acetylase OafA/YrhL|nr:acyltransferase [Xanthobacteraceae bacterium]